MDLRGSSENGIDYRNDASVLGESSSRSERAFKCHSCSSNLRFSDVELRTIDGLEEWFCKICFIGGFVEEVSAETPDDLVPNSGENPSLVNPSFSNFTIFDATRQELFNSLFPFFDPSYLQRFQQRDTAQIPMHFDQPRTPEMLVQAFEGNAFPLFRSPFSGFASQLHGNPGDYVVGDRHLEQVIEQLMQADEGRGGNPPASQKALSSLPRIIATETHVRAKLDCAVCKEEFQIGAKLIRMPCSHEFCAECLSPWLSRHNNCPTCRFELGTDDPHYERRKAASNISIRSPSPDSYQ
mmetsp:Transcript_12447/g.22483  ORF Transcript_12447/g.22483 Transcript_12447/m.22483 type:complete len:296 (+) Transcript_12447:99-986(+)